MTENSQPTIIVLPEALANQIAAGEVVERPANAVKELVENAIDAEATEINILLEEGGLQLIQVTDNGIGMSRENATLCIQRHATSKITQTKDLFQISTLGFRGEALPSIASVSRFSILTKTRQAHGGTRVEVEAGKLISIHDAASPPGTEITIRDLFFNTPARLKFLKTRATELRQVVKTVQRLALSHPNIRFQIKHNGKSKLLLPTVTNHAERVFSLVGREVSEKIYKAEQAEREYVKVWGFFSDPSFTRRTNDFLWIFVNGRFIRDKTIHGAIRVAYRGLIDRGRYPIVILFISMPPKMVDVNVHPTKIEVRFHEASLIFRAVRACLINGLGQSPWVPDGMQETQNVSESSDEIENKNPFVQNPFVQQSLSAPTKTYVLNNSRSFQPVSAVKSVDLSESTTNENAHKLENKQTGYFQQLHYIGQYKGTYLLATDGQGLIIVDQHAAHERITFALLRRAFDGEKIAVQPLLIPQLFELDSLRATILRENLDFFTPLGFEIEPFGGEHFALKATPALFKAENYQLLIEDTLDDLDKNGDKNSTRIDEVIDHILIRIACHKSVRGGDTLQKEQVYALFQQMDSIDFGANCPHGRPVFFQITNQELEKRFDRS